jgi:RNA polymerase sigma-70 factor (ECF subfamily)
MDEDIVNIWNDLNKALVNFINQKVKNSEISKDISQDVFIKVFSKIDTLKNKDKIIPWIYQITRNEINSYFRKQEFGQEIEVVDKFDILDENLTVEFSKCIQPMINSLPLKYQEAIKMTEIEGVSQKELAKSLNISYSGAKSRVQRGREMLKSLLQQCCTVSSDKYGNITDFKQKKCNNNCD